MYTYAREGERLGDCTCTLYTMYMYTPYMYSTCNHTGYLLTQYLEKQWLKQVSRERRKKLLFFVPWMPVGCLMLTIFSDSLPQVCCCCTCISIHTVCTCTMYMYIVTDGWYLDVLLLHNFLALVAHKRKKKNWEENDYYDSDEDTFLDRTGSSMWCLLLYSTVTVVLGFSLFATICCV